jgi:hypothetical protein
VTPNVYLENVLGGADQLLHGDRALRGWGAPGQPDPVLLVPRGFERGAPGGPRFRYDVNPRFGTARGARALVRAPFRVTVDFALDLAVPFPVQQLRRAVEPVRGADGTWGRRSADSLAAFYLARTSSIHRMLLSESDSLFLSAAQIAALRRADSVYSRACGRCTCRSASSSRGVPPDRRARSSSTASRRPSAPTGRRSGSSPRWPTRPSLRRSAR